MRRVTLLPWLLGALLCGVAPAQAQVDLQDLLLDLLRRGVTLSPPAQGVDHSAHFSAGEDESDQFRAVRLLNSEVGRQLASFPQPSSAGSFSYTFDPDLGVLSRPTQSFGSVYTDRPFTVGKGKYNLGLSFSQFSYDQIDGLDLRDGGMQLVFLHQDEATDGRIDPFFEGDIVTAELFVDVDVNVAALSATYGVSERLDWGLLVPILDVSMDVVSVAQVEQLSTGADAPDTHVFANGTTTNTSRRGAESSGVGDVSLRARWLMADYEPNDFRGALAWEIRFPTGDERNFQGGGGTRLGMSVILAKPVGAVGYHAVAGVTGASGDLPYELQYAGGIDWSVDPKLTLAADLLGRYIGEQPEVQVEALEYQFNTSSDGGVALATQTFPTLTVRGEEDGRMEANLSLGFKLNVGNTLLLTCNGLIPLNDTGLRDDFSTLLGLDYTF